METDGNGDVECCCCHFAAAFVEVEQWRGRSFVVVAAVVAGVDVDVVVEGVVVAGWSW